MTDAKFYRCSFGGGWLVPVSRRGKQVFAEYFGERPAPLDPIGGQRGYVVEPYQLADVFGQEGLNVKDRSART